ncbi:hypothetical protein BDB00DRAFT_866491 [Zychaea mexicana]|uniref:uncharacterized protein n=1 Tax=Zychaea mexicana TaxID=64656 RepID=UPI0022FE1796|nr:uncharacterized protein BDB00DRAFT_866491 [Zychaea mexicana]KAI9499628.1 hypothetical protein BDB00DRAFT_866491 [Zychaea mexicana]
MTDEDIIDVVCDGLLPGYQYYVHHKQANSLSELPEALSWPDECEEGKQHQQSQSSAMAPSSTGDVQIVVESAVANAMDQIQAQMKQMMADNAKSTSLIEAIEEELESLAINNTKASTSAKRRRAADDEGKDDEKEEDRDNKTTTIAKFGKG